MYRLETPSYFYLFVLLPLLVVLFFTVYWWRKKTQRTFSKLGLLEQLAPNHSFFKAGLKLLVLLLSFSFLILSLVNPKMGTQLKTIKREGVDLVFALDVSKSMLAEDIAPNRLEKSKQLIAKTIERLGSDRIGVIVYAGNAYPLLPITTDHASANMFLQNANPDMVSSQGTAINEALNLAKTYYNNEEQTNKFLVILSDGEDHESNTIELAESLSEEGIKVFTIGVGTEKGGPIPVKANGRSFYKKDRDGEVVITHRNPEVLRGIAEKASGFYIDGNTTNTTVDKLIEVVSNAQKHEFETKQFSDYKDQFQWFVAIGLFFILLDTFLYEKKTKWLQKVDLFNEKKQS
ncbi:MAG: VWA domain-containing protein [Flavicella sp.]